MRLLWIAVEKHRWDLAAHAIVLAMASVLKMVISRIPVKGVPISPHWEFLAALVSGE
jgi:hypothetical protein